MVDCVFYKQRSSRELESTNVDLCLKKIKRIMHKYVVDFLLIKKRSIELCINLHQYTILTLF